MKSEDAVTERYKEYCEMLKSFGFNPEKRFNRGNHLSYYRLNIYPEVIRARWELGQITFWHGIVGGAGLLNQLCFDDLDEIIPCRDDGRKISEEILFFIDLFNQPKKSEE